MNWRHHYRIRGLTFSPVAESPNRGDSRVGQLQGAAPLRAPRKLWGSWGPPRPSEGRAPLPATALSLPPPPPRVNPSSPAAGSERRPPRGWSCRVSSRERPGKRPACLQAPGLAAATAQARPPALARATRLPGAAAGGRVP